MRAHEIFSKQHSSTAPYGTLLFVWGWDLHSTLRNLKRPIDEDNGLLVFLLNNKLDKTSRDQWELSTSANIDLPSLNQLNQFLDTRIRTLETTASMKKRSDGKCAGPFASSKQKINVHQNSTNFSCLLCKEEHNLFACPRFKNKSIDERHDYIRTYSRCYNCLGKHLRRSSQSKKLCIYCSKFHHSLLHKDQDNSVSNLKESRVLDSKSDPSVPVSSANLEGESAISSHLNASMKMFPVLLATV